MRVITQTVAADGTVTNVAAAWTQETLTAAIAAMRYEREISGITVSGIPISTERGDHRIVMAQLRAEARANAGYSVNLKTATGFVTLDASTILTVTGAMLSYINACFVREAVLLSQIASGVDLDTVAAAAETGWPSQEF